MIDHVLERPQSGHVGFRFFNRGIKLLQLLAHGRFLTIDCDVVWSKPVHQLVTKDVCEEGVKSQGRLLRRIENDFARSESESY